MVRQHVEARLWLGNMSRPASCASVPAVRGMVGGVLAQVSIANHQLAKISIANHHLTVQCWNPAWCKNVRLPQQSLGGLPAVFKATKLVQ